MCAETEGEVTDAAEEDVHHPPSIIPEGRTACCSWQLEWFSGHKKQNEGQNFACQSKAASELEEANRYEPAPRQELVRNKWNMCSRSSPRCLLLKSRIETFVGGPHLSKILDFCLILLSVYPEFQPPVPPAVQQQRDKYSGPLWSPLEWCASLVQTDPLQDTKVCWTMRWRDRREKGVAVVGVVVVVLLTYLFSNSLKLIAAPAH